MRQADIIEDKLYVPSLRAAFSSFFVRHDVFHCLRINKRQNNIIPYKSSCLINEVVLTLLLLNRKVNG